MILNTSSHPPLTHTTSHTYAITHTPSQHPLALIPSLSTRSYTQPLNNTLVSGRLEPSTGIIDAPIKGKKSVTRYSVVGYTDSIRYGTITTVDLFPITGRQHQLRKHMTSVGHPILGNYPLIFRFTH